MYSYYTTKGRKNAITIKAGKEEDELEKRPKPMTTRRICIALTPEVDRKIVQLRKKPEYERKSLSEVARIMMLRGMEMEK